MFKITKHFPDGTTTKDIYQTPYGVYVENDGVAPSVQILREGDPEIIVYCEKSWVIIDGTRLGIHFHDGRGTPKGKVVYQQL